MLCLLVLATGVVSSPAGAAPSSGRDSAVWAEPAGTAPDYIFPFEGTQYYTAANVERFQYLMYRPLYWFDEGSSSVDRALSLAEPPVFSNGGTTVTITLGHYRWSDGEAVTARDVMFWMNMLHAEKENWGPYQPGTNGIPDDVTDVTVDSPTTLTLQLDAAVDPEWLTDDQLSQITPLPVAWDRTTQSAPPGSGGCSQGLYGTVDNQCAAVFTFLSEQAGFDPDRPRAGGAPASYATNPLWRVVDGPWRLEQFTRAGRATFVPNPSYSGPVRPSLRTFVEVPFGSDQAELSALSTGQVDVGYLPQEDVTAPTADPWRAGPNDPSLAGYTLAPLYAWSIDFIPYNFDSDGDGGQAGAIFRQLYLRQAVQDLVDQPGEVSTVADGYGVPTYGPVPVAGTGHQPDPYPYDPARARALLSSHGWQVRPGATSTCARPGTGADECGAGIARGARLSFTLRYADDVPLVAETLAVERAAWSRVGIEVRLVPAPATAVLAATAPCSTGCSWELADWGGGWLFDPDHYPTGEDLFATDATGNAGGYSDPTADADIAATTTATSGAPAAAALSAYSAYLAAQLPVVFQPRYPTSLTEVHDGLEGVTPQSTLLELTPEEWRWRR